MAAGLVDDLKLRPPRLPPDAVARPALLARLAALAERDFLVLAAPAGFGKSSALAAWAATLPSAPAWISLGEEDASFQALFPLVCRALAAADPAGRAGYERLEGLAREAAAAPEAPRLAAAALARAMRERSSAAPESAEAAPGAAGRDESSPAPDRRGRHAPLRLVLDDVHRCPDRAAAAFLLALSDLAGPELRIALCGRREPELPMARLRAEGRLGELRARDLRFAPEEVLGFLPALAEPAELGAGLAAVEARLEGWPAGLRLLKLSLEDSADPAALISRLASSRRFVLDYLVEEVLAGLDPELADFLFRTSLAEPFGAELAAALLELPGAAPRAEAGRGEAARDAVARAEACLRRVAAENLFLVPLDEAGLWYRYHHLFGDLLRMRAPRALGEALPGIRTTAASWYEARGMHVCACAQLLDGNLVDATFDYLVRSSREMYISGRIPEILGLYDRLPFEAFRGHPDAAVWYSWFLATQGRSERVPTLLAWAEAAAPDMAEAGGEARVRAGAAMIRGLLALRAGELRKAAELEAESQRLAAGAPPRDRAVSGYIRGLALAGLGELEEADRVFEESEGLAAEAGDAYTQGMALCERARILAAGEEGAAGAPGEPDAAGASSATAAGPRAAAERALGLLSRAAALGTKPGGEPELWVGLAYVHEARILADLGRDEAALARVREGLALCLDRGFPPPIALARRLLFDLALKAGELERAGHELAELEGFARATGMRSALDSAAEAAALLRAAAPAAEEAPRTRGPSLRAAPAPGAPAPAAALGDPIGPAEPLSPRELEVLGLLADGMTNQEIAAALFVSLATVKTHVHHIAAKLGSANRTETAALARELGLLRD